MLFNSMNFAFFFLIVTAGYFALPHKTRWGWLLAASCYFYMAFVPKYILILGATIVIDYFGALWLDRSVGRFRKAIFIALIASNIAVLAVFKYYNFILDSFQSFLATIHLSHPIPHLDFLLPIGLSFHTFQAMSYLFEVYRRAQKPERHFGIYALFVMFYPQLVAGPIERPQNLLHQFHEEHQFNYDRLSTGLRQMLWGLFKKIVVADRLGMYVDAVYNHPHQHNSSSIALATVFLAFQIYADFSGYSDIAIGAARVMGFDLMTNFKRPYFAQSFNEFWGRWHISLSTWFKDYLYFPLGGSRGSLLKKSRNIMIVFGLSGLWHGANWTYCVWGLVNGLYRVIEGLPIFVQHKASEIANKLSLVRILRMAHVFFFACLAWVFFRADSFTTAGYIIKKMFSTVPGPIYMRSPETVLYPAIGIGMLVLSDFRNEFFPDRFLIFNNTNPVIRRIGYCLVGTLILLIGSLQGGQFIYFQF